MWIDTGVDGVGDDRGTLSPSIINVCGYEGNGNLPRPPPGIAPAVCRVARDGLALTLGAAVWVVGAGGMGIMVGDTEVRTGQCHCGAVRFRATLGDGFGSIRRCTCSYCRMRGAVVVMAAMDGVEILAGEDLLTRYRFHTGTAQHFFCSRCGIYTHHRRRSDGAQHAVNVACLDGISPFDFAAVPVMDGVDHPADTGGPPRRAGTLRFVPAG